MIFFILSHGNPSPVDIQWEFGLPNSVARWPCLSQYNIPMKHYTLPIIIERDAERFYVSCPPLQGCYSQGDTYDEALSNI
jgi:hypothetical protein